MGNLIRIKASATSHVGMIRAVNKDNFNMNGRFIYEYETDNIQVSTEGSSDFFSFAVSDSMDIVDDEKNISISVTQELKKYQDKVKTDEKDLKCRTEQLFDIVQENFNLIQSIYSDNKEYNSPSFACVLIKDDKASVISLGSCKVFLLREGSLKQLTVDWGKTERLLKLGIITNEQASVLANRYGIPTEDSVNEIRKTDEFGIREGDTFLLCTNGLTDLIELEDINEIFYSDKEPDTVVNKLIKLALKKGGDDNITALAVRIERFSGTLKNSSSPKRSNMGRNLQYNANRNAPRTKKSILKLPLIGNISAGMLKIITGAIICLIIFMIIFAAVKLLGVKKKGITSADNSASITNNNETLTNEKGTSNNGDTVNSNKSTEKAGNEDTENKSSQGSNDDSSNQNGNNILPATYVVKKGDTLYKISKQFYNDPNKYKIIMEANNINDPSKIQIGSTLTIPDINN
ncbi:MAG TPA: LysM peptidoglycan-binding domain-containing protein [Clostridiales bacterium]|nr:LysM peptidoglycan-binding domain-containing protein [Clostridiales bacterium]